MLKTPIKYVANFKLSWPTKLVQVFQLAIMVFVSGACTRGEPLLFYDETCSPPCWAGILPGKTTRPQSLDILAAHDNVDFDSLNVFESVSDHRVAWLSKNGTGGQIKYENDVVSVLTHWHDQDTLTIGEVFNKLGQPPSYLPIYHKTEIFYLTVYFLYPQKGFVALIRIDNVLAGDTVVIDETLFVDSTFYFEPSKFEYVMTEGGITLQSHQDLQRIRTWEGYGEIDYDE